MEIKLGDSNLRHWQNHWDWEAKTYSHRDVTPGIKVCSASNRKWLGVITGVGEEIGKYAYAKDKRTFVQFVEIFWLSGPNKGKHERKETNTLVNYDAYKASIAEALKELEDVEAEASKTGM